MCCLCEVFSFAVSRFRAVHGIIPPLSTADEPQPHGNPLKTGYKYNFTDSREQFRRSWYLPADGCGADVVDQIADGVAIQTSSEGCAKVRWRRSTKRDRAGLWIWVCMRHHRVVGYHVMPKAEGLRDPVLSICRFKKHPPKSVFMDFACGCEETSLNWAPTMFKDVQFFHDAFHGLSHKCSSRFKSKRFPHFASFDTSIMEQVCRVNADRIIFLACTPFCLTALQVNAFLSPLKDMMVGSKTRVCLHHEILYRKKRVNTTFCAR